MEEKKAKYNFFKDEENWEYVEKIMKKIKPFIAIAVLIFIVISTVTLIKHFKLQEEIRDSCGYQKGEEIYCVCDKRIVSGFDLNNNPYYDESFNFTNVSTNKPGE